MRYLLDTSLCVYIAKQNPPEVLARFRTLEAGAVAISVVTYAELRFGAQKSSQMDVVLAKLELFVEAVPVVPMGREAGVHYGKLRFFLERRGTPIGNNDLWIASHCLELGLTLVTNNEREFNRIPDLVVENWTN